ncbi:MAG: DUF1572 family protein [Bacteroidetes bacterium]|nr:DUF1572 family protein [Bacteroidota bacterium]
MTIGNEYLSSAIARLKSYKELADKTFDQLDENDFHFLASSESNSIAILVHHISGNMLSRFTNFLTEDGEKEWRDRDDEFETHKNTKAQIIEQWEKGWTCLLNALTSLEEKDLLTNVYVRKEPLTALDAINRQLAHYASHIGQILFIGKMIKNQNWQTLSIPKGHSQQFNQSNEIKDPAKKF